MRIIEERAKHIFTGPGPGAYAAEITIEDDRDTIYVHVFMGEITELVVSKAGYFNALEEDELFDEDSVLERYSDIDEVSGSEYQEYFDIAMELIDKLS